MKNIENNMVTLRGEIISDFQFSHETFREKFYLFDLKAERHSDAIDILPVIVSERLLDVKSSAIGAKVVVNGQLRSFNKQCGEKRKLILTVFTRDIENVEESDFYNENEIVLRGYICKEPVYRKTPLGREITDLVLAVNRPYGKSDYIPCICWERNARFLAMQQVGTEVEITGRFQSREYTKRIGETEYETRTVFEVSVSKLEVIENECKN